METVPVSFILPVEPKQFIESAKGLLLRSSIDAWQEHPICKGCPWCINLPERKGS